MPITQYNSSVRQMSQSKFNSMKNASGKIPDLANQIVMTNSEDSNTSCLRTEVVYDMTSSDASKNWGYPNGIQGGVNISGKDFSRYERLRVYAYTDWYKQSFEISTEVNSIYGKINTQSPDSNNHNSTYIKINTTNNGFNISFYSVNIPSGSSTWTLMNGNSNYYIYKIEGVLKTPSMIYTGDELIAGNGISIANGVISNITNILSSYYNRKPSAITTTSSIDITTGTFTKKSATSKIIVLASAYIQDSTGGYGSVLRVNIDGSEAVSSLSNTSKEHCILCPISNRASGNHTFSLQLVAGAGSATIPSYNDIYLTFLEVE